jgi:nucleoside 2-deoxyribosyltransferase
MLKMYGPVLTEHVSSSAISDKGEHTLTPEFIFTRDQDWLKESDVVIAEISNPSLGVGYELGHAEALGKKILCLYRNGSEKSLSNMISGNKNMNVVSYNAVEDLLEMFKNFLR